MKKKLVFLLFIFMILLVTGCGSKNNKVYVQDMVGLSDKYIWVSVYGIKYDLKDLDGNNVYELNEGFKPASTVINKYFFAKDVESNKLHLYNISGEELFKDSDRLEIKSAHKGNKLTSDYIYAVSVWHKIDEDENEIKMYLLDDELTEITDEYVNGNYAITNMYHVNDADGFNRPDLLINPFGKNFYEYYIDYKNEEFSIIKNGEKLYDSIKGSIKVDNCGSYNLLANIEDKYYIVSSDGNRSLIDYIPENYSPLEYCDGYITVKANFKNSKSDTKLFNSDGKEVVLIENKK